jgi:endonuclease/exonuclease/phosphatase (EEP) superfamily protein YafD
VICQQLAAVLLRRPWFLVGTVSWVVFGLVTTAGPWRPLDTGTPAEQTSITIAVANVAADNPVPLEAVDDILDQGADVVVVPEATPVIHAALAEAYDHAVRDDARYSAALGIYSDLDLRPDEQARAGILVESRIGVVEVGAPEPFTLWGLHLPRPWFRSAFPSQLGATGQAEQLDRILERADADRRSVLAGDLNLTDRGRGYRRATERHDDALRGIWGRPTSRKRSLRPLLLRIDHVLVPEGWCADGAHRFDVSGSDHRGVAVRIGPCKSKEQ